MSVDSGTHMDVDKCNGESTPVIEVMWVYIHRQQIIGVGDGLDVGVYIFPTVRVPPQDSTRWWWPLLPAARAKHDPVHPHCRMFFVLIQQAFEVLFSAHTPMHWNCRHVQQYNTVGVHLATQLCPIW